MADFVTGLRCRECQRAFPAEALHVCDYCFGPLEVAYDYERIAATIDLNFVRRSRGEYLPLASPQEAAAYPYSPAERGLIARNRGRLVVGTKATVLERLRELIAATKADEVMVTTMIYDHAARRRSYELLAEAFELRAVAENATPAAAAPP